MATWRETRKGIPRLAPLSALLPADARASPSPSALPAETRRFSSCRRRKRPRSTHSREPRKATGKPRIAVNNLLLDSPPPLWGSLLLSSQRVAQRFRFRVLISVTRPSARSKITLAVSQTRYLPIRAPLAVRLPGQGQATGSRSIINNFLEPITPETGEKGACSRGLASQPNRNAFRGNLVAGF